MGDHRGSARHAQRGARRAGRPGTRRHEVAESRGRGVPTTETDRSRFKNCQEPPGDSLWQTAKAEEVGLDDAALQKAADFYRDNLQATMRVYRFNCLVKTGTFDPIEERRLAHMFSTTKPTMTLVAGRAVELGLLSVDDTIGKYFPDKGDDAHRAITVKQLLQHRHVLQLGLAGPPHLRHARPRHGGDGDAVRSAGPDARVRRA